MISIFYSRALTTLDVVVIFIAPYLIYAAAATKSLMSHLDHCLLTSSNGSPLSNRGSRTSLKQAMQITIKRFMLSLT